jgi:predicted glycosyltransferase
MVRPRKFLLHSQSLTGTGHFVKSCEIAAVLVPDHHVVVVDGGRTVPRPKPEHPFSLLPLPQIFRCNGKITPVEAGESLDGVMDQRRRILLEAIDRFAPDGVVIDHFPFHKWDLGEEIVAVIRHARTVQPGVKVFCSLWDIPLGNGDDPHSHSYREFVLRTLRDHFDAVLVHADPRLIRLEEQVPWTDQFGQPIHYTGIVSEKLHGTDLGSVPACRSRGSVIVSTGGASYLPLLRHSVEAWRRLKSQAAIGDRTMIVFLPPFVPRDRFGDLTLLQDNGTIRIEPFTPDYLRWLATADLCICQSGYNTCANILETRTRAIVVPNPAISDQPCRAQRLAERGLVQEIDPAQLDSDRLAAAILKALTNPAPAHDLNLEGARKTREILEAGTV